MLLGRSVQKFIISEMKKQIPFPSKNRKTIATFRTIGVKRELETDETEKRIYASEGLLRTHIEGK